MRGAIEKGAIDTGVTANDVWSGLTITRRDSNDASPLITTVSGQPTDTLNPPNGYVQLKEFEEHLGHGFEYDSVNDELIFKLDGLYTFVGWLNFRHSQNNSTVAVVFGFRQNVGDAFTYSSRPTANKKPNNNDLGEISGGSYPVPISAGTRLSVHIASDNTGNVTSANANLTIECKTLGL